MRDYPVEVKVTSPAQYDRIQLVLRIALAAVVGWIGVTAGDVVWLLYVTLPLIAAIAVSVMGGAQYLEQLAPRVSRVVTWLIQLSAYMMLITDRFPAGRAGDVRVTVDFTGKPTVGSALLRLLTSIPSGLVLALLWCVSAVLWVIGALVVLFARHVPHPILAFMRGVLRWQARLVGYHASFVAGYPPFALETEESRGDRMQFAAP